MTKMRCESDKVVEEPVKWNGATSYEFEGTHDGSVSHHHIRLGTAKGGRHGLLVHTSADAEIGEV